MKRLAFFLPALLLCAPQLPAGDRLPDRPIAAIRHVMIVSVDGLRPDLLLRGPTPNMHALMKEGSYTFWARTIAEGYTLPSHLSMLTGVVPGRHGVTWDNHIELAYSNVPTLFELARGAGYTTGVVAGKTKFIVLTKPGTLDWSYIANEELEDDFDVARHASTMIREHQPDVLFVHFGNFDTVGHASGWGSTEQMRALGQADQALGIVERAMAAKHLTDSTLMILTADHGGEGRLHSPEDVRSQFIPWIAVGPSVRRSFDLTNVPDLVVNTMSTFATACAVLGIQVDYALDGQPVWPILDGPLSSAHVTK